MGHMSLSEAEKRKILRERRQQKFSRGGASERLNKIVGGQGSQLDTKSALDEKPEVVEEIPREAVKPEMNSSVQAKKESTAQAKAEDPQVELFRQLAEMQGQGATESTPDLFSMMKNLGATGDSPFPMAEQQVEAIDPELVEYHKYRVNTLTAKTTLVKWIVLLVYIFLLTRTDDTYFPFVVRSYLPEVFTSQSSFFSIFLTFEILATSIYYQLSVGVERETGVKTLQDTSKIVSLVSMVPEGILPIADLRGKVILAMKYWNIIAMMIGDVCFVLVAIGLVSQI